MTRILLFCALSVALSPTIAAPITFKCVTEGRTPAADLVVDIVRKTMTWGGSKYTIHHITARYISAYQQPEDNVGGEVWVLDRTSGDYFRATVSVGYDTLSAAMKAAKTKQPGTISAKTYTGRCSRPLL